jgi:hypothetical protein
LLIEYALYLIINSSFLFSIALQGPLSDIPAIEEKKLLFKSSKPKRPFDPREFTIYHELREKEIKGTLDAEAEPLEPEAGQVPLEVMGK